ncbi:protein phosphatase 2C domain-containing protein [Oxalobacteraceae bacterium]|nr:protein phosphatase 2C domain-containing protein [Oxalobacteraceae bacterium]
MMPISATLSFGSGLDVAVRSCASVSKLHVPENQDNFVLIDGNGRAVSLREQQEYALQVPQWPAGHVRLAVFDGMGGHGHGREAAEAAAMGVLAIPACASLEQLSLRLDALHAQLQEQFRETGDQDSFRRPGTTLTLIEIAPGCAPLLYHVGDSRLYEIAPGIAQPLTIDHVPATAFAIYGLLGAPEWWQQVHGEHRAQISQAFILGNAFANPQLLDDDLYPLEAAGLPPFLRQFGDRRALTVRPDALYLLATDGLWACQRPQEWTSRWPQLVAQAGGAAGPALAALFDDFTHHPPPGLHIDNLTAIAFRFSAAKGNIDETALPGAL